MKKIIIILLVALMILPIAACEKTDNKQKNNSICGSTENETVIDANETENQSSSEREQETVKEWSSLTIDEIDAIDFVGMTYHEIVRILGSDYEDVGSGAIILQWRLDDGRLLSAWMVKNGGSSLEDCIVQSFEIE